MSKSFEITRWDPDSPRQPEMDFLVRMMAREGLQPVETEWPADSHSQEMKYQARTVIVAVTGKIQYSFPGYGVIELTPGDVLEIQPDILHDVIVPGSKPVVILQATQS